MDCEQLIQKLKVDENIVIKLHYIAAYYLLGYAVLEDSMLMSAPSKIRTRVEIQRLG